MSANYRVYDRCQYIHCRRGRHKGDRLFRFPKDPEIWKKWIKNSGNNLLRSWAPATIKSAGLCALHFKEEDFTNNKKIRLKRKILPVHWQSAVHDQRCTDQQNAVPTMQETVNKTKPRDEHEQMKVDSVADENVMLEVTKRASDVTYRSVKDLKLTSENVQKDKTDLFHDSFPRVDNNDHCIDIIDKPMCSAMKPSSKERMNSCSSVMCKLHVQSIMHKVTMLKKTIEILRKNLKNEKAKNARVHKRLDKERKNKIRTTDDLLNNHTLTPSARTKLKLQFHKNNTHYLDDKKVFCKIMCYHSVRNCSSG